jgi:ribonuclease-3
VLSTDGADHSREYEVAVLLLERRIGHGRGSSKKLAEEDAARAALKALDAGLPPK